MHKIAVLLIIISLGLASEASVATALIKTKNLKLSHSQKKRINKEWTLYLKEKSSVLYPRDASGLKAAYRSDQLCIFNGELLDDGAVNLDSLKLEKHNNNFEYNLAAIEFLRRQNYKFPNAKKKTDKKIVLIFKYLSY